MGDRKGGSLGREKASGWILPAVLAAITVFFLCGPMVAQVGADTYPSKPLRFILPFPPGGPTDILGRIIGLKLAERVGQPVVPENRPGAGGNLGLEVVAKARPDGYTIGLASPTIAISPTLYKKLNYDPAKDLGPISLTAQIHNVLLVRPSLPVKSVKELVEYAKAHPGKLTYGSSGMGTSVHLACELFTTLAKVNMLHVVYKGSNQAMIGMIGNEVDMVIIGIPPAQAQIQAGKVRPLAVLSGERLPAFPEVPTIKEAGIDNFEVTTWYGMLAPAGTPRDILSRLSEEWRKIAAMPDTKERMQKAGFEPLANTPEKFTEFVKTETVRWGKVIRDAKLSLD